MNGRDARLYEQAGLLTQRTVMAHGVTLTTSELRLLADRGTAIAHCPLSNFYFADVPLDVQRCLKAGVKVQHPPPRVAAGSNDKQSGTAYIDIPHVIVYGASFGKNSVCALLSDGLWAVDVEQLLPGMAVRHAQSVVPFLARCALWRVRPLQYLVGVMQYRSAHHRTLIPGSTDSKGAHRLSTISQCSHLGIH